MNVSDNLCKIYCSGQPLDSVKEGALEDRLMAALRQQPASVYTQMTVPGTTQTQTTPFAPFRANRAFSRPIEEDQLDKQPWGQQR